MQRTAAWRLLRPGNGLMTAAGVGIGAVVATAAPARLPQALAGALAGFAFTGAGNALNDVVDLEVDRTAHPDRPLPQGHATPREALALSAVLFAVGLAAGAYVGPLGLLVTVTALVLLVAYEAALKARGLAGNAVVAVLTGFPFLLGGVVAGDPSPAVWVLAALATLATLGRELMKDIEDMDADVDRRTFPRVHGVRAAAVLAAVSVGVAVLLSPLPLLVEGGLGLAYVPLVLVADAGFVASAWHGARSPGRAQRLAKTSMQVALGAFLVGRLIPEVPLP